MKSEMSLHFRRPTGIHFIISVSIVFALFATLAVSARSWMSGKPVVAVADQTGNSNAGVKERFPIVILSLTRFGFEPGAIRVPAGRARLVIQNRSGQEAVTLELSRQAGPRLVSERYVNDKPRWEKGIQLTPGDYMLSETEHPEWRCQITVTPPGK